MTRRCMAITTCGLSTFSSKPAPLLFIVSLSPKRTATERGRERIRIHHPQQPGDGVGLGSPCSRRTNWRRNDSLRTAKSAMSTQVCPPHRLGAMRRARASRDDAQGLTGVLAEGDTKLIPARISRASHVRQWLAIGTQTRAIGRIRWSSYSGKI